MISPEGPVTSTIALPDLDESAWLTAVSVTGFIAGSEAGARKSMAAGLGPAGATHGFEPIWQIWPTLALPLATPFTSHVTAKSGVFITLGVKVIRSFTPTDAEPGETETATLLVIVTGAETTAEPPVTALAVACTVTIFGTGTSAGAVYNAVLAPEGAIIPSIAFPPSIPFTSQEIVAPAARQNVAAKFCASPSPTLGDGWAIELAVAQVIVTLALPDFAGSATLVAVMLTIAGDGTTAGAVYEPLEVPFAAMVPSVEFPPAIPFTLQVTVATGFPVAVRLMLNTCAPPAGTEIDVGETWIAMSSCSVTIADADTCGFALLIAVTMALAGEGKIPGAVYKPVGVIDPPLPDCPGGSAIVQRTEVSAAPLALP